MFCQFCEVNDVMYFQCLSHLNEFHAIWVNVMQNFKQKTIYIYSRRFIVESCFLFWMKKLRDKDFFKSMSCKEFSSPYLCNVGHYINFGYEDIP